MMVVVADWINCLLMAHYLFRHKINGTYFTTMPAAGRNPVLKILGKFKHFSK
jgi:hypothetical protein